MTGSHRKEQLVYAKITKWQTKERRWRKKESKANK